MQLLVVHVVVEVVKEVVMDDHEWQLQLQLLPLVVDVDDVEEDNHILMIVAAAGYKFAAVVGGELLFGKMEHNYR